MDAKSQVQAFERLLKKTLRDYERRIDLRERRNKILSEINKNRGAITPELERDLLAVLDDERKVIGILSDEGKLEIKGVESALDMLNNIKKEPSIIEELERRNINFSDLKEVAEVGMRVLKQMKKRLHHIEERILIEEGLIGSLIQEGFDPQKFRIYMNVWKRENREEEKFLKSLPKNRLHRIYERIRPIIYYSAVPFIFSISYRDYILALGAAAALGTFLVTLNTIIEKKQRYVDFKSKEVFNSIRRYRT